MIFVFREDLTGVLMFNLLNELGVQIKCEACRAFYLFFATSVINSVKKSTNVRFY